MEGFDLLKLGEHYSGLHDPKTGDDPISFLHKIIFLIVKYEDNNELGFKRYIDSETHLALERAGFKGDNKSWSDKYRLTQEGYNAVRSATIETFVQKLVDANSIKKLDNLYSVMVSLDPKNTE